MVRFLWANSTGPRNASHALHFWDNVGTQSSANLGTDLLASLTANMWRTVASTASIQQILITPLDGISSTYSVPITIGNANISGAGSGEAIPQGATVVTVVPGQRGKQWRNRTYVPFVGETEQNAGTLSTTSVATMQAAWTTFGSAMTTAGWTPQVVAPSEPAPDGNAISFQNYTVRPYLKTQRRRARR